MACEDLIAHSNLGWAVAQENSLKGSELMWYTGILKSILGNTKTNILVLTMLC